jgi:hypothetical protein
VVVLSNVAILAYLAVSINDENSHIMIHILGVTLYSMKNIAILAHFGQVSLQYYPFYTPVITQYINQEYETLSTLNLMYATGNSNWTNCDCNQILFSNSFPVYMMNSNQPTTVYSNMHDFISIYLTTVLFIQSQIIASKLGAFNNNISDETDFLECNAFGKGGKLIDKLMENVVKCQEERANVLAKKMQSLIAIGISLCAICSLLLVPFILFSQVKLNTVWNHMRTLIVDSKNDIKEVCIERLDSVHNSFDNYPVDDMKKASKKTLKFNYLRRYLLRLGFFIVFGVFYYLIANYAFYTKIETVLLQRPEILYQLISIRTLLIESMFWGGKSSIFTDPSENIKDFNPLNTNYASQLNNSNSLLYLYSLNSIQPQYQSIIGSTVAQMLIATNDNSTADMTFGSYGATLSFLADIQYAAFSQASDTFQVYILAYTTAYAISNTTLNAFKLAVNHSVDSVTGYINTYIAFACVTFGILILCYFMIFAPFLASEQEKLKWMEELSSIIAIRNAKVKEEIKEN